MKDAYYFSHDSNAKDDPKCVLLIEQLGLEGYGIFWVLIETLRDQPEYKYPLALIPALARRYNTTAEKVKTVVMQYGLFETENEEFFFSESLCRRMEGLEHKREVARLAGQKSAEKRKLLNAGSADVQQTFNDRSTSKVKESKVNKSKGKESKENTPVTPAAPSLYEQVRNSFIAHCPSLPKPNTAEKWTDGRKKAVRDKKISVEEFTEIFKQIERSDFLTGRTGKWHGCSLDWILKPANWQKIVEGNYNDHPTKSMHDTRDGSKQLAEDIKALEDAGIFDKFDRSSP